MDGAASASSGAASGMSACIITMASPPMARRVATMRTVLRTSALIGRATRMARATSTAATAAPSKAAHAIVAQPTRTAIPPSRLTTYRVPSLYPLCNSPESTASATRMTSRSRARGTSFMEVSTTTDRASRVLSTRVSTTSAPRRSRATSRAIGTPNVSPTSATKAMMVTSCAWQDLAKPPTERSAMPTISVAVREA